MKTTWKYLLITFITIILSVILWQNKDSFFEKKFKQVTFEKVNIVSNKTDKPFLDTIVHLGLKELHLNHILVVIKPLPEDLEPQIPGMELKAFVIEQNNQYLIYIRDMNRKESLLVLSHEMIHIAQYYTKDLQILEKGILWKKSLFFPFTTPYEDRPWEQEAFLLQDTFQTILSKQLY